MIFMDLTYHTEKSMSTPKNSLVLVHQNIGGIISKIEDLQEFFCNGKIYPHILCFSEYHMSRDDVHFFGIENYVLWSNFSRSTFQKGGVCIYIRNDVFFNYFDFSKYGKENTLEICAVQIVTTEERMIVMCEYRSPSGDFNHFLRLLDMALLSLNKPSIEIPICGDFNVDNLLSCHHKQKLSLLLGAYNMMHTVGISNLKPSHRVNIFST